MNSIPISFGKRYIREVYSSPNESGLSKKLDFVEYEKNGKDLLKLVQTRNLWEDVYKENNTYIADITKALHTLITTNDDNPDTKIYGLEDKDCEIQAICQIEDLSGQPWCLENTGKPETYLKYICTNPKSMHGKKHREYSKLGTSLFKEILVQLKKENTAGIVLLDSSGGFWEKIPNIEKRYLNFVEFNYLPKEKFNSSIKKLNKVV